MTRTVRILQRWLALDASGYAGVSGRAASDAGCCGVLVRGLGKVQLFALA